MRSTRSPASGAVAALAFGTETIDPVDLVVGPAQPAISEAKRRLFGERGIDLRAPTGDLAGDRR